MNVLALDVGGTAIKSAHFINGTIDRTDIAPSDGKLGGQHVIKKMMDIIESYDNYDVISISTAGQVDSDRGYIIYANENIPNYTGTYLADIIRDKFHKPVFVENDVNAAAIGEGHYGAGRGENNFLCLTYGTGIGGAIIINNELYKGSNGIAGEMGHMVTHLNGIKCNCSKLGCYEQYASTTALIRSAVQYDDKLTNGVLIFEELNRGNQDVKNIVDQWIKEIIYGLVNLIHVFNPSCVILGGGIMKQQYIIDAINNQVKDYLMDSFRDTKIVTAKLGNNAGVYGMEAIANIRTI